jgi:hypothetical protein
MFAVPIVIAFGAVKWAEHRGAKKREDTEEAAPGARPEGVESRRRDA